MMHAFARKALEQDGLSREEAHALLDLPENELFASATALREHYFGNRVEACFIVNAKSGDCNMN